MAEAGQSPFFVVEAQVYRREPYGDDLLGEMGLGVGRLTWLMRAGDFEERARYLKWLGKSPEFSAKLSCSRNTPADFGGKRDEGK